MSSTFTTFFSYGSTTCVDFILLLRKDNSLDVSAISYVSVRILFHFSIYTGPYSCLKLRLFVHEKIITVLDLQKPIEYFQIDFQVLNLCVIRCRTLHGMW